MPSRLLNETFSTVTLSLGGNVLSHASRSAAKATPVVNKNMPSASTVSLWRPRVKIESLFILNSSFHWLRLSPAYTHASHQTSFDISPSYRLAVSLELLPLCASVARRSGRQDSHSAGVRAALSASPAIICLDRLRIEFVFITHAHCLMWKNPSLAILR